MMRSISQYFISLLVLLSLLDSAWAVTEAPKLFLRLPNEPIKLEMSSNGRFIAYELKNAGLNLLDMKNKKIFKITGRPVGGAFLFSPGGFRVFYRELYRDQHGIVHSNIMAYDSSLHKSIAIESLNKRTGFLTFDPRDLRLHYLFEHGIRTKKLEFPDNRLAKWQQAQMVNDGKWIVTQKGMLWVTKRGHVMRRLADDGKPIHSFDVSADGNSAAWSTQDGNTYISHRGSDPINLGRGRSPQWHPQKTLLAYSAARMVGKVVRGFDLRVVDGAGRGRFVTATQFSDEDCPIWHPMQEALLFIKSRATDLYTIRLGNP